MQKLRGACRAWRFYDLSLLSLLLGGCSHASTPPPSDTNEAGNPAGSLPDAGPPLPYTTSCDPSQPFGAPTPLVSINEYGGYDAYLSPDERHIYFSSTFGASESNQRSLFTATRTDPTLQFSGITKLAEFPGEFSPSRPNITADGSLLLYTGPTNSAVGIYALPLPTPVDVENINLVGDNYGASYLVERQSLLCVTNSAKTYGCFPWNQSSYLNTATDASFTPLPGIPATIGGGFVMTADGLTVYAAVDAAAPTPMYKFQRATTSDSFGPLTEMNDVPAGSQPAWISPDNCRLYMVTLGTNQGLMVAQKSN